MAVLAFVFCLFVLPASSLCQIQGAAPVVRSTNRSIIYGEVGQAVRLTCETTNASDTIAWYFNNEPMLVGSGERGVLTLSPLRVDQGGWYTCAAANRFGRDEEDFLVVAGSPPVKVVTFDSSVYRVPVGYYAELPCHFVGSPHPTIQWFDASGGEIVAVDNRYEIISSTGSLIVHNSNQQPEMLLFYCTARNMFKTSVSNNITVEFFLVGQLSQPITFPLLNSTNHSLPLSLSCTNLTNPGDKNYTVSWIRNLASVMNTNTLMVAQFGYYCCRVSSPDLTLSHFCTTVFDSSANPQLDSIEPPSISLPLNRNRTVGLLCSGSTPSGYDPPLIEWSDGQNSVLRSADDLNVTVGTHGLGYLSSSRASRSAFMYTCRGSNVAGSISTSATVQYIATCSGSDVLRGGNAELSTEVNQHWTFSGPGARVDSIHNENVFVLEYNRTASAPSIAQTVIMPDTPSSTFIDISGRMRQVSGPTSGVARIQILVDDVVLQSLDNPYPNLPSWHWVGERLQRSGSNLTVVMTLTDFNTASAATAYFDDLCVTFPSTSPVVDTGGEGLEQAEIIAIAVGAGGGVILLLIIVVFCCSCYCCCCAKKKQTTKMMTRVSTLIKKKHSAVLKEFKRTEGRDTAEPGAQKPNDNQVELYAVADPHPGVHLESSYNSGYVNPENYTSAADGQHSARIPSVVVERPVKSTNANQENGVYTSLKPGTRDKDNVYQAPASHPSSTSLQNLVSGGDDDDEHYVDVERGSAANFMHLLACDEERVGRSSSHGSRGRSPCPEFPPPLPPTENRVYEESQGMAIPSVSSSGAFRSRRTSSPMHSQSASQLTSPTSLQSGADNQIYENSQEVVPSSVPLFSAGSLPRAMDGRRSTSPRSPHVHVTAPPLMGDDDEQQIYENSEEVNQVMMEGEEEEDDDIYENDIPGMNQQYPNSNQITGKQYANVNS